MYPIFYLQLEVAFKKGNKVIARKEWAVSTYDTPGEIMRLDRKTMDSLSSRLYPITFKGERKIIVRKVLEKKTIGNTTIRDE
jgi:hypothetical protein